MHSIYTRLYIKKVNREFIFKISAALPAELLNYILEQIIIERYNYECSILIQLITKDDILSKVV